MNAEFQRIATRDKKAFLSDQCKEIEKNTRDVFKKIRDTKENLMHRWANKGQKLYGPKEQKLLGTGGKNTQKNYTKKDLHDPDNHDGVITHLEPDILECEVKWVLGGICTKLVEVMGFQLSYFKS